LITAGVEKRIQQLHHNDAWDSAEGGNAEETLTKSFDIRGEVDDDVLDAPPPRDVPPHKHRTWRDICAERAAGAEKAKDVPSEER
jgi:hypothetical protein